ncbi:two-component system capsular synthesis response regulator RcsB [Pedobacter africanus]|uniref:DNA-binding NarL/FixJ family response regulator n=1 Tax=Pedobacter africanus TaxID=151894 RepID=A0ACC6KS10_9SPHI|nr:response regulator [Pedobacter africanus]MDR6781908.1 DNA-binding NarL/FixJ family response regulator [Pedobacter africanus]
MMFKRVLIAEDHENSSSSLKNTLEELGVKEVDYVAYCDHALSRIKKGLSVDKPYDLMITDLSFEEDGSPQDISDGATLIKAVKDIQPDIKILVFTVESKSEIITPLIKDLGVHAYVRKARRDIKDLKLAIEAIFNGKIFLSGQIKQNRTETNSFSFTSLDVTIISLIVEGKTQMEISLYLQASNVKSASLSSIEKRLSLIKNALGVSNTGQLIAYCKDNNII